MLIPCFIELSAYFLKQLPAGVFALVTKALTHHAEDAPHAGLDIPSETAGAVEIVAGVGAAVYEFHVEGISDADGTLQGNDAGVRIIRLLAPLVVVNGEADISRFICWHHRAEDYPFVRIRRKNRRCGISVYTAAEYH